MRTHYVTIGYHPDKNTDRFYVLATLHDDIVNGDQAKFNLLIARTCKLAYKQTGQSIVAYDRQDCNDTLTIDRNEERDVTPNY